MCYTSTVVKGCLVFSCVLAHEIFNISAKSVVLFDITSGVVTTPYIMCDFRFPPQCKWGLHSSGCCTAFIGSQLLWMQDPCMSHLQRKAWPLKYITDTNQCYIISHNSKDLPLRLTISNSDTFFIMRQYMSYRHNWYKNRLFLTGQPTSIQQSYYIGKSKVKTIPSC